ncbi:ORF6N domain-containing protein [Pedobacter sp. MC2016-14]|uniref:ORF6N domain-containing protein n=1 Tax=Pedobacter sp. MC2016-14 TaxID=2897327 RepID=UPI001E3726DA|nr:ORF6N domain-containing protein [Pedobacter sp. MC2016-14]MCD0487476.1 ORF6N domain-containing protein [Pedobacter sp. MC2016-14]
MGEETQLLIIPDEIIMKQIYYLRGHKVMLDADLAALYEVETKQLKRQVKRNIDRFPEDFMFELSPDEYQFSRSQIGTLKQGRNIKYAPMVFTEQGVAMLSSILNSKRAIQMNIQIIRIFTHVRQMLADNTDLRLEVERIKASLRIRIRIWKSYFDTWTNFWKRKSNQIHREKESVSNRMIFHEKASPFLVYEFIYFALEKS